MSNPYITPKLFTFLRDLRANNDRDWFNENKTRYEQDVKEPLLDMIADFIPFLAEISPHFQAIPKASGGSLFRIYRDVRFSKNKNPYKTHAGVHFRHASAKDVHCPGYYFHLEPDNVFIGMGIWQPDNPSLSLIRKAIVNDPDTWQEIVDDQSFTSNLAMTGDTLKRPPAGFDAEHPLIEDLKRKDFVAMAQFDEETALRPDLLPFLAEHWKKGTPFMRFISEAIQVPF